MFSTYFGDGGTDQGYSVLLDGSLLTMSGSVKLVTPQGGFAPSTDVPANVVKAAMAMFNTTTGNKCSNITLLHRDNCDGDELHCRCASCVKLHPKR